MRNILLLGQEWIKIYTDKKIPRAAAALSYYLTATFFPMVICLYTLLGNSYDKALRVVRFAENIITPDTMKIIEDFLQYVALNHNKAMLIAGLSLFVTSSSATIRTIQATIGDIQGEERFHGLMGFVFSIVFSILFVLALYFAITVMLTGKMFLNRLTSLLPVMIDAGYVWNAIRFPLLAALMFVILFVIYTICKPNFKSYAVWPGALFSAVASVVTSQVFAVFIGASARYSLVYGSLASVILLMIWLYFICIVVFCGASLNIVLRDLKG